MSDINKISHDTVIPDLKLDNKIKEINDSVSELKLSEYYQITSSILNNIENYFANIYNPSLKYIEADKILSSKEYNQNNKDIIKDFNYCFAEIKNIRENLKNSFNRNNSIEEVLNEDIKELKDKISIIENHLEEEEIKLININNNFSNLKDINKKDTTANVDVIKGTVSLKEDENLNHIDSNTQIDIKSDSNGFKGNSHEVQEKSKVVSGSEETPWEYVGAQNSHSDIDSIKDQNPDTWFEYELCNIPQSKKEDPCKGFGFKYKNGEVWAKDPENPNYLILHLNIILDEARLVNFLNITPHTLEGINTIVDDIYVKTELNGQEESIIQDKVELGNNNSSKGQTVFQFPPKPIKSIGIKLKKKKPYPTMIGHKYFVRTTVKEKTDSALWISDTDTHTNTRRVEGMVPTKPGSTEGENVLFGLHSNVDKTIKDEVKSGLEAFNGRRWAIGIKDIALNSKVFEEKSKVITTNYSVPGSIKKIELESNEFIPKKFYEDNNYSKFDWIKYYISIDDGGTWKEIIPNKRIQSNKIKTYYINSNDPVETSKVTAKNLIKDKEINNVKLKIEILRPQDIEDSKYYSPVVNKYNLKVYSEL